MAKNIGNRTVVPDFDKLDIALLLKTLMAFKKGDFTVRMPVEQTGIVGKVYDTLNDILDLNERAANELQRVSTVVGKEGRWSQRAALTSLVGSWANYIAYVNDLIADLTQPTTEVARVITSVANGDLSQKMALEIEGRPLTGEFLRTAKTVNTMVDQLGTFASEVTRVAREVGTEGKLGGQAKVEGVSGTWKDLTDNVNFMAANLTAQVRNIAEVTTSVATGDLGKKITIEARGEILELKDTINKMVDQLSTFAAEVTRVAREVGTEGKLGGQAKVEGVSGTWKDLTDNVNFMAANLTGQVRNIAEVTTAVATGDLGKKITIEARGEILELKDTINRMVEQLGIFASEVTRVAREVGTDGKLGGQAKVEGVSGTWKDLTENVNLMAANLTSQVRGIAKVVTSVANGNLRQKLTVEARGEILELAETINSMIDTLATFADQVTSVAREVGVEGRLGGQANVPGTAGIWKDLTDNVNRLAANLTTQVRAIAEVATAVTKGDLTRSITVEAKGEVESLKNNINEMIRNLRDTTRVNTEQDWLKTNLTNFSIKLQGQKEIMTVSRMILSELAPLINVHAGVFYIKDTTGPEPVLRLLASYGYKERRHLANHFKPGEGLAGQCVMEKQMILLSDVPGDYIRVSSALGEGAPQNIAVLPVIFEGDVLGVVELASFKRFSEIQMTFLEQLAETIGIVLNTISATMRTEELLKQSQSLTTELQSRQKELTETNERLQRQAKELQESEEKLRERSQLLEEQKAEVENKNSALEQTRIALQQKAEQLALTSRYKSEFLANMSHELRTPLNSMQILSNLLADNSEANLTEKQVEYAKAIHSSGADLLNLINEILDLSKIESGKVELELTHLPFQEIRSFIRKTFEPVSNQTGIGLRFEFDPQLPPSIHTDEKRLQQVLKNLLSNAFKFTENGEVTLAINVANSGWDPDNERLNRTGKVIAFAVTDTGVGIPADKQRIIFEAFQQADSGTSRKYGGTGLGLAISREIATFLGGEVRLTVSIPGEGSTFTLYLPQTYSAPGTRIRPQEEGPAAPPPRPEAEAAPAEKPNLPVFTADLHTEEAILLTESMVSDDRAEIKPGERLLLIVEDDANFARILVDMAHVRKFRAIVAPSSESGMAYAHKYAPHAVILDIILPGMDGLIMLDMLKRSPETRHIPVHVISAKKERDLAMSLGAMNFLPKPVSKEALEGVFDRIAAFGGKEARNLLIAEDDERELKALVELLGDPGVAITSAGTGEEVLAHLEERDFDCVVLDLLLPDMKGFEILKRMRADARLCNLPVIVHTGKELTAGEESELKKSAGTVIVKGPHSPERLYAAASLFLHTAAAELPEHRRRMLKQALMADELLAGKKVLIVDDDMRNIFALTGVLEQYDMKVLYAENGKDGIELLNSSPNIDIVLMDIMMPMMDGYEAMRRIRAMDGFSGLSIIALTAKAMKGDREKCMEAGASDYIAKPVNVDQLVSMLRVWLHR